MVLNLAITNLYPSWQEPLLLSKQLMDILKGNPEPTSLKARGWKSKPSDCSSLLFWLFWLCFNEEVWYWQSHTSAVPLPPRSACWNPASTCNLLTLLLSRVSWAHQAYQCDREQGGKKEQNWEMLSLQRKVFPSQSSFWQLTYKLLPAWLALN